MTAKRFAEFLRLLALRQDGEEEEATDRVTLTTIHGAKGLEWRVVFLIGLEEGLLPHARTLDERATDALPDGDAAVSLDEERRLFYVAVTRAKDRLYMSRAKVRGQRGKLLPRTPSRFLVDVPPELYDEREEESAVPPALEQSKAGAAGVLAAILNQGRWDRGDRLHPPPRRAAAAAAVISLAAASRPRRGALASAACRAAEGASSRAIAVRALRSGSCPPPRPPQPTMATTRSRGRARLRAGQVAPGRQEGRAVGSGRPTTGTSRGATSASADRRSSRQPREGAHSWGLPQLVHMLQRSATAVARKHRGSQMLVGDLSGRTGGHLDRHASHQTGRDADVGFYVMNSKGKPMSVRRFIAFDDAGNARDAPGVRFDEARNWAMVESMLKDDKATVRYLFITNALRGKLLAYAAEEARPQAISSSAPPPR